jgi:hypothetical protein
MTEADVVVTDYLLTVESVVLAVLVAGAPATKPHLQHWFVLFFSATALASLAGGTVHGFFQAASSAVGAVLLWRTALVAIGVAAASAWTIGGRLVLGDAAARTVERAAWIELVGYSAIVILVTDAFWVAIVNYLPAVLFLAIAFGVVYRATLDPGIAIGLVGLGLTLVAAALQRTGITVHPLYFTHNALYHSVQAVALLLLFLSARGLIR